MQWERLNITSQPTDEVTVFEKLKRLGAESVTFTKGDHVTIEGIGKMLSVYKDSYGRLEQKQIMLGAVLGFHMPRGASFTEAMVQVSREPEAVFGRQIFDFGIHKLRPVNKKQFEELTKKAREAVPRQFLVSSAGGSDDAATVRPRPMMPGSVVKMTANSPLRQIIVRLCNVRGSVTRYVTWRGSLSLAACMLSVGPAAYATALSHTLAITVTKSMSLLWRKL